MIINPVSSRRVSKLQISPVKILFHRRIFLRREITSGDVAKGYNSQ